MKQRQKEKDLANRLIRTAGRIEFVRDQGPLRRDIRAPGFKYSEESLEKLAEALWNAQRAHAHAMAAHDIFSKMPSSSISPDGLLGGRGYIQSIKDMRTSISQSIEILSAFNDTIEDEINAGHWESVRSDYADKLIDDADDVKDNPNDYVDYELDGVENDDDNEEEDDEEYDNDEDDEDDDYYEVDEPIGSDDWYNEEISNPDPDDLNPNYESGNDDEDEGPMRLSSSLLIDRPDYGTREFNVDSTVDRILNSRNIKTASIDVINEIGPGSESMMRSSGQNHMNSSDDINGYKSYSGTNESQYMYDDPIGDQYPLDMQNFKVSYSMLPGSNNNKIINKYTPGLTKKEISDMEADSNPTLVDAKHNKKVTSWDAILGDANEW